MHVLVVSPIPSHPVNQGNSARIRSIASQLQALGHVVHFFYYPLEGLTAAQRHEMEESWDFFHTMPADVDTSRRSLGDSFGIDDWYDGRVSMAVRSLHERWRFGIVLVNYVWFSAVLDQFPDSVMKVIDTHDVFGDRHLRFAEMGMSPQWFYTTAAEERRGLARAHVVIAIQDVEEKYFKDLLRADRTRVETVGYLAPASVLPRTKRTGRLVLGYLGSANPFNVASIQDFTKRVSANPEVVQKYRFLLAGSICRAVESLPPFEIRGPVDAPEDFYSEIDCAINPMHGGTGLKIKTLEALAFGKMVGGTADAFLGVPLKRLRSDPTARELERDLGQLGVQMTVLSPAESQLTFREYVRSHLQHFRKVMGDLHGYK